jgi:DNA-directed RNA polymerase, mitochondrial
MTRNRQQKRRWSARPADGVDALERASSAAFEAGTRNKVAVLLEGKFVNLVDLLLPRRAVPMNGEFDVNKIESSLYFFS